MYTKSSLVSIAMVSCLFIAAFVTSVKQQKTSQGFGPETQPDCQLVICTTDGSELG
jgi:hypothetical protein